MKIFSGLALILLALLAVLIVAPQPAQKAACAQCDIILISIDTLAASQTTPYVAELSTMPLLAARAAAQGVVFERAYAQASWTLPSHAAMLTGKYPWDLGVWEFLDALPLSSYTLAERLKDAGYRTALFSNGSFVQPQWHFDQGFDEAYGSPLETSWNDLPRLSAQGLAWFLRDSQQPSFLFLRPFEAHDPYRNGTDIHDIIAINSVQGPLDAEEVEALREGYRSDLEIVDRALSDLFASLERSGRASSTIVLITSDHGEEFGEHGTAGLHGTTVYDESIHVPLIAFVPGVPAARIRSTVEVRSIPATLLELAGVAYAQNEIGASLAPHMLQKRSDDLLVRSRTRISREELLATLAQAYDNIDLIVSGIAIPKERTDPYQGSFSEAARIGDTKIVRMQGLEPALYALAEDPGEQNPLPVNGMLPLYLRSYIDR